MRSTHNNFHTSISSHLKVCDYLNRPYPYGLEEISIYLKDYLIGVEIGTFGQNLLYFKNDEPVMEYSPSIGYLGMKVTLYDHLCNLLTEDKRKDSNILLSVIINHILRIKSTTTVPLFDDHFKEVIYRT